MALTDLLKGAGRVVQAAALGLVVYGCGGNNNYTCEDFCKKRLDCCNYAPDPEECIDDVEHGPTGVRYDSCTEECLALNYSSDWLNCWTETQACDKTELGKQCGEPH